MSSSDKNIWKVKGATLSDKSAMEEYGLTQAEIASAINNGKFQYLVSYAYENPYFKLIRTEIEQYIIEKYGKKHLEKHTLKNELEKVNKNLRTLKSQVKKLEIRKEELQLFLNKIDSEG